MRAIYILLAVSANANRLRGVGKPTPGGAVTNPEEYMNILGGTQNYGSSELSFGNVMPDVTLPWGFSAWAPQQGSSGNWWFDSSYSYLQGGYWGGSYARRCDL
jgi:putative alpha-1,2-mannosidase